MTGKYKYTEEKRDYTTGKKISEITGCIALAAGFALVAVSRYFPDFAQWYGEYVYPLWVGSLGRVSGIFPWSLSELLLYVLAVWILAMSSQEAVYLIKYRKGRKGADTRFLRVFAVAAGLFLVYVLNCGINYHRQSFAESSGIELREYSSEELMKACLWLTEEVNALSSQVDRDEKGVMELEGGKGKAGAEAVKDMQRLGETYDVMAGYYPRPKGLLFPWILSVQQVSGIYSPFTIEANYNSAMTDYCIPFTMCHELSHLRGFMQEQEANYIAFLACIGSDREEFRYSGYLEGWVYCMNVLYRTDYDRWEKVREKLADEVEVDLAANRSFWASYDGTVAEVADRINDTYLKANGQAEGVKSYNRMVDLIVICMMEGGI